MDSADLERYCTLALVRASDQATRNSACAASWSPEGTARPLQPSVLSKSRLFHIPRKQSCDLSRSKGAAVFDKAGLMQQIQQRRASLYPNLLVNTDLPTSLGLCRPPVVKSRCVTRKNASKADLRPPQWAWSIPQAFHLPPLKGAPMKLMK